MIDNFLDIDTKEYKVIFDELGKGEAIIKNKIDKNINFDDKYEIYGIVDMKWAKRYKKHIMNYLEGKCQKNEFTYSFDELKPKNEKKKFFLKNDYQTFHISCNYILVTLHFISLISNNFNQNDKNKLNNILYPTLIGGQCIIRKSHNNELIHYITVLYDDNDNNNVDYILLFKDKIRIRENLNLILNKNFWFYTKFIDFSLDLQNKDILDSKTYKVIGHIICNCDNQRRSFLADMINNNNYQNINNNRQKNNNNNNMKNINNNNMINNHNNNMINNMNINNINNNNMNINSNNMNDNNKNNKNNNNHNMNKNMIMNMHVNNNNMNSNKNMNNNMNMNNMNKYINNNNANMNNMNNNMNNNLNNNMNMNNMNNNMNNNNMNMNNMNKNNMNENNMNNNINNMNENNMNNNIKINKMNNNINNNNVNMKNMNNMNNNMNNNLNNKMNNNINNNNVNMNNNMNMNNMNNNYNNNMNNNINMNNMNFMNNNIMSHNINNIYNIGDNTQLNNKNIFLTFTFEKFNKQIFIDVNGNEKFFEVIKQLEEKYFWFKKANKSSFYYKGKIINNYNLTINQLGIGNNSDITIKI